MYLSFLANLIAFCKTMLDNSIQNADPVLERGPLLAHLEIYSRLIKHNYFPNNELQEAIKLGVFYVKNIFFLFILC